MFNNEEINEMKEELIRNKKNSIKAREEIQNLNSISDFEKIFIISKKYLSAQSYGAVIEKQIKSILNMSKKKDEISGDSILKNKTFEIKVSIEGLENLFHFVQLRPFHNIDYYLMGTYTYSKSELLFFLIPHEKMNELIGDFGGYAHGTIKLQGKIDRESVIRNLDKHYEYALRPDFFKEDNCWLELQKYKIDIRNINSLI